MNTHRHGLGVAVLNGPLYAVGGHDGWSCLSTVERYDYTLSSIHNNLGLYFVWYR